MIGKIIWDPKGSSRGIGLLCRHCQQPINSYPFFSKNKRTRGGKKWYYHASCAVELGLIDSIPTKMEEAKNSSTNHRLNPLGLKVFETEAKL